MYITVESGRRLMGRLPHGCDLLEELTRICQEEGITLGKLSAIGALSRARVGYYDQEGREYRYLDFDQDLELLCLMGNVSLKDGRPMVHAHVVLGDAQGRAFGGHLAPGCRVFACEFILQVYQAPQALERRFEPTTGLVLWSLPED